MAARFPQSGTSVAYQIKAAWASKIKVLYWAADADKVHRLRSGDTATTVLTRSASGCTFDAANGVIAGNNNTTYFTDSIAGGYGALQENSNFVFGGGFYGDLFNGISDSTLIGSVAPPDGFSNGFRLRPNSYTVLFGVEGSSGQDISGAASNDVVDWVTIAVRHDQADATADLRPWLNGSESTADRVASVSPTSTAKLGDSSTGTLIYLGGSATGTGNTKVHFEFAFLAGVLSDADMATITSDPASVIEVASSPTRLAIPTSQLTLPRSALAASSSHSFRRFG